MKRPKNGSTPRQEAYAMRRLAPKGTVSRRQMALAVGYAPSVADKVTEKIESTEGYANALASLASKTGNVALKILNEVNYRDLSKTPLYELMASITVLANAWETFTPQAKDVAKQGDNPLRAILLERREVIDAPVNDSKVIDA